MNHGNYELRDNTGDIKEGAFPRHKLKYRIREDKQEDEAFVEVQKILDDKSVNNLRYYLALLNLFL